jgi:3-isopropylmalate/(R)-2-methylmalate dehydratase large subunit
MLALGHSSTAGLAYEVRINRLECGTKRMSRSTAVGMTMAEKILASHAKVPGVKPGDVVETEIDTVILIDLNFLPSMWLDVVRVDHPERVIVVFDHLVPAKDVSAASAHDTGRKFVEQFGIERFHDVGPRQGIVHQVVGDEGYALPGSILVCADSHTCAGGAFNAAARGLGALDIIQAVCTGRTWWECGPTVRYELSGTPRMGVTPKDVFLHMADRYGYHTMQNIEFYGQAVDNWQIDERRALATMCAEVGAEFPIFPFDEKLASHLAARGHSDVDPVASDPDAVYLDRRTIEVGAVEPMIALPGSVVNNCRPVSSLAEEKIALQQCFIGSCANGTLEDIEIAARIMEGKRVHEGVRFIVTPGSQKIYGQALAAGYVKTLNEAGALVTTSACGACAGLDLGVLAAGERALTSSTRNFKGRMGSPHAEIYIGSSATVAASAIEGCIADPREVLS